MSNKKAKNKKERDQVKRDQIEPNSLSPLPQISFDKPASVKREKVRHSADHKLAGAGKWIRSSRLIKGKERSEEEDPN